MRTGKGGISGVSMFAATRQDFVNVSTLAMRPYDKGLSTKTVCQRSEGKKF